MSPSTKQILGVYRNLLATARKFDNYNFREYSLRKVHDSFKQNKDVSDKEQITTLYNQAIDQLALLNRQTTISQMFTFDKLVVEPLKKMQ